MSEDNNAGLNGPNLPVTVVPSETPLFAPQTINAAMGEFASKLAEIVSIPSQHWPANRTVRLELGFELVPKIVATIDSKHEDNDD